MSKITYTDKVALSTNPDIDDINKVNAEDMNEIKTVTNNNDDIIISGWIPITATLSYVSANGNYYIADISENLTDLISVGMKIKLTQTTVKYFWVANISATQITLFNNDAYTLANASISNVYYSVSERPSQFPTTTAFLNKININGDIQISGTAKNGEYNILNTNDIVDNLTSTSTIDALSANQGKLLKDYIDIKNKKITAYRNGTQQINATTFTHWSIDTVAETYDNTLFSITNNRIKILSTRVKSVCVMGRVQFSGNISASILYLTKNDGTFSSEGRVNSETISATGIIDATLNDTIGLAVYTSAGTTITNTSQWCRLEVFILEIND